MPKELDYLARRLADATTEWEAAQREESLAYKRRTAAGEAVSRAREELQQYVEGRVDKAKAHA